MGKKDGKNGKSKNKMKIRKACLQPTITTLTKNIKFTCMKVTDFSIKKALEEAKADVT
jgi:hypothetical protein